MKSFYTSYQRFKSKLRHIYWWPVLVHFWAEARCTAPHSIFVRLNDNRYGRPRAYHSRLPRVTLVSGVAADTVYYRGSRRRRNSAGLCPIKMSVGSVELLNNAAHSPSAAKPTSCHLKSVVGSQYVEEEMALDIKSKTIKSFTPHVSRLVPKQLGRVRRVHNVRSELKLKYLDWSL